MCTQGPIPASTIMPKLAVSGGFRCNMVNIGSRSFGPCNSFLDRRRTSSFPWIPSASNTTAKPLVCVTLPGHQKVDQNYSVHADHQALAPLCAFAALPAAEPSVKRERSIFGHWHLSCTVAQTPPSQHAGCTLRSQCNLRQNLWFAIIVCHFLHLDLVCEACASRICLRSNHLPFQVSFMLLSKEIVSDHGVGLKTHIFSNCRPVSGKCPI